MILYIVHKFREILSSYAEFTRIIGVHPFVLVIQLITPNFRIYLTDFRQIFIIMS